MIELTDDERSIVHEVYRQDFEALYNLNLVEAANRYVIVRAITMNDITPAGGVTLGSRDGDDPRYAVAYEVQKTGPLVEDERVVPGAHVRYISASAMPTRIEDGRARGKILRVDEENLTEVWDPREVAKAFVGTQYDREHIRKKANGLQLDGSSDEG